MASPKTNLKEIVTLCIVLTITQIEDTCSADVKSILDGGTQVGKHEFPWMLGLINKSSGKLICGGTILSEVHLLTSGRCVHEWFNGTTRQVKPSSIKVIAGDNNLMEEEDSQQIFDVLEINVHPDFIYDEKYQSLSGQSKFVTNKDKSTNEDELKGFQNDLAILTVSSPFNFTDDVKPIKLFDEDLDNGETLIISGWGITDKKQNTIPTGKFLKKVEIDYTEEAKLPGKFGLYSKSVNQEIIEFNTGIGNNKGLMGRCIGDPGGAVVCETSKGPEQYALCGVVSFGIWCDRYYPTGQFVGLKVHTGWINSFIGSYLWAYISVSGMTIGLILMAITGMVIRKRRNSYKR